MKRYEPMRRRLLRAACSTIAAAWAAPSSGVTVLDSTWRAEGGRRGREAQGLRAHVRLATQAQFRPVLALASDGSSWGEASCTWIGNSAQHAFLLTAAHIFEDRPRPDDYQVRGIDGRVHIPDRVWVHEEWNGEVDERAGFDLAVLRLPITLSGMGPAPALYTGDGEIGRLITFVGYGMRGTGSTGEDERFATDGTKAAAQGVVDEWVGVKKPRRGEDRGNTLGIFMPKEDGSIPNPFGGPERPVTRLVGLLGAGDSGGSAWMESGGEWVIVGVNSNGDGKAGFGDSSWFTRVSSHRKWIGRLFPGARFAAPPANEPGPSYLFRPGRL